jgi:uncharacterized membrane protein
LDHYGYLNRLLIIKNKVGVMSFTIQNEAVLLGVLVAILGTVFYTSQSTNSILQRIYKFVPALLLCYFIPSLLNTFDLVSEKVSYNLYFVASRFLLPASLVLLTLGADFKRIVKLGPKAGIMFLTGTVGIVIGGPIALLVFGAISPDFATADIWRGMTTIAGSWIGGGANQAAMKEVFEVEGDMFSIMVTVDIIVANLWMAVLLIMAGNAKQIDAKIGADTRPIEELKLTVEAFQKRHSRITNLNELIFILAIGFGVVGIAHFGSDLIAPFIKQNYPILEKYSLTSGFFWIVVIATTIGLSLSFTKLRMLEGAGASKVGSAFIYVLVATIGLQMDITAIIDNFQLFLIGFIWMAVHAILLLVMARLIKAPLFYMAVGSQANVGGAASAPVVAAAFHPSLAPVGVLLAVVGYGLGTYAAYFCGLIMQTVAT